MKQFFASVLIALALAPTPAFADAVPGKPAPTFEAKDANGKAVKLGDYSGKWVVLEWFNKDCPYVRKHYGSKNMQTLQADYTKKGVIWLTVNSSATGKQGHTSPEETLKVAKAEGSNATTTLLDHDGKIGKAYGAKTTPHMFVIDPKGLVVYAGAIDDNDSSNPETIKAAKNYVRAALDAGMEGKKIETATARPYGCGVKY